MRKLTRKTPSRKKEHYRQMARKAVGPNHLARVFVRTGPDDPLPTEEETRKPRCPACGETVESEAEKARHHPGCKKGEQKKKKRAPASFIHKFLRK